MTDKELIKLRKIELLELLLEQSKELERTQKELEQARAELRDKDILIESSGSIAEAAIKINKVFEAAQAAADQYLKNVKRIGGCRDEE